jgi:hypothetical protein
VGERDAILSSVTTNRFLELLKAAKGIIKLYIVRGNAQARRRPPNPERTFQDNGLPKLHSP